MPDQLAGVTLAVPQAESHAVEAARFAATGRLASMQARRFMLPHDPACTGSCRHRNCRAEHAALAEILDALALDGTMPADDDYSSKLSWASISRSEIALAAR